VVQGHCIILNIKENLY